MQTPDSQYLLPWREMKLRVPYTRQHLMRLEKRGEFPKRIRIGGKVAWLLSEVNDWITSHAAERDGPELGDAARRYSSLAQQGTAHRTRGA